MIPTISLRKASPADLSAVDRVLMRSYPKLLAADYPPSTMVLAVPRLVRAKPELLASGRYFVAEDAEGRLLAVGGWSRPKVLGAGIVEDMGHVRHVATDPSVVRQGVGRALMERVMQDAQAAGMGWLDCLATRTAVGSSFRPCGCLPTCEDARPDPDPEIKGKGPVLRPALPCLPAWPAIRGCRGTAGGT
jgi:GNAT superfamily N-acetyltransferase